MAAMEVVQLWYNIQIRSKNITITSFQSNVITQINIWQEQRNVFITRNIFHCWCVLTNKMIQEFHIQSVELYYMLMRIQKLSFQRKRKSFLLKNETNIWDIYVSSDISNPIRNNQIIAWVKLSWHNFITSHLSAWELLKQTLLCYMHTHKKKFRFSKPAV